MLKRILSWQSKFNKFFQTYLLHVLIFSISLLTKICDHIENDKSLKEKFGHFSYLLKNRDLFSLIMMMMMMLNCFCDMVDRQNTFSLISNRDYCQRSSPSWISDTPWAEFEPAQNLSSCLVEWSFEVVITTTPQRRLITHLFLMFVSTEFWNQEYFS